MISKKGVPLVDLVFSLGHQKHGAYRLQAKIWLIDKTCCSVAQESGHPAL